MSSNGLVETIESPSFQFIFNNLLCIWEMPGQREVVQCDQVDLKIFYYSLKIKINLGQVH